MFTIVLRHSFETRPWKNGPVLFSHLMEVSFIHLGVRPWWINHVYPQCLKITLTYFRMSNSNERWMEVNWLPGLCVGRRVDAWREIFFVGRSTCSKMFLSRSARISFWNVNKKDLLLPRELFYILMECDRLVESGTDSTSFVVLLQEINDFSFDYFHTSVVEIRCHSRYCNYVTQLLIKEALSRYFALL